MKKLTTLLAIFAIAGLGLTSCDQSGTDYIVYPSFEKVTLEERTDGTFFGRFDVTCAQTSSLKEVTASYTYGSTTISIPDQDLDITKGKNYVTFLKPKSSNPAKILDIVIPRFHLNFIYWDDKSSSTIQFD